MICCKISIGAGFSSCGSLDPNWADGARPLLGAEAAWGGALLEGMPDWADRAGRAGKAACWPNAEGSPLKSKSMPGLWQLIMAGQTARTNRALAH